MQRREPRAGDMAQLAEHLPRTHKALVQPPEHLGAFGEMKRSRNSTWVAPGHRSGLWSCLASWGPL